MTVRSPSDTVGALRGDACGFCCFSLSPRTSPEVSLHGLKHGVKMGGAEDELSAAQSQSGLHVQQLRKIIVTQSLVAAAVVIL